MGCRFEERPLSKQVTQLEPLLVRANQAAALCGVSPRMWADLRSSGKLPPSFKLGGCVVWKVEHLRLWIKWDMPNLVRFEQLLAAREQR